MNCYTLDKAGLRAGIDGGPDGRIVCGSHMLHCPAGVFCDAHHGWHALDAGASTKYALVHTIVHTFEVGGASRALCAQAFAPLEDREDAVLKLPHGSAARLDDGRWLACAPDGAVALVDSRAAPEWLREVIVAHNAWHGVKVSA